MQDSSDQTTIEASSEGNYGPVHDVSDLSSETQELLSQIASAPDTPESQPPSPEGAEAATDGQPEQSAAQGNDGEQEGSQGAQAEGQKAAEDPPPLIADAFNRIYEREKHLHDLQERLKPVQKAQESIERARERWKTDRLGALDEFISSVAPGATDAEYQALYQALTDKFLGVSSSTGAESDTSEVAKLRQELQQYRQQAEETEKRREEERLRQEHATRVQAALTQIGSVLSDSKDAYPHLNGEALQAISPDESPEQIVWGVLWGAHENGDELTIQQAAEKAETFIKNRVENLRNLLAPSSKTDEPTTSSRDTSKSPRSQTLTNASASEVPSRSLKEYDPDNEEAWLQHTLSLLPD